ncbi:MAG: HAMP domain-containing sensor histidine kinase [Chloroflexota bacterium]|jgi:signal transduction histidine kinase|nr:HAMP domain-containing sensor histidine kinase [Chloroflexota bacterium]MQG24491.1 HAMP domain-containing histidine kinase [SAR202 cluster bacterium]|tara:strand:- start:5415 stop:6938 length:1524 start_codon:yes stop_codon:yes gene_type:complete
MKKIFRLNLQAQIIFSFFVIISLSFVASFIATETIWKRSIDERNLEYRSKITNIVSNSLGTYYQSWGSFDQGFENVLLKEMTNLGLAPEDTIGVVDQNYEWIIASPNAINLETDYVKKMIDDDKYIISPINIDFSEDFLDQLYGSQIRRIRESYRLGLVSREVAEQMIIDLQNNQNNSNFKVSEADGTYNTKTVGYLVFINKNINLENAYSNLIIMSFMGIFLISIIVAYFISLQIASPVKNLRFATEKISRGVFQRIEDDYSSAELSNLTESFNTMVDKMTEIQTQREQLFSDISHELRNPLTVLRVNIEGIMENKIQVNQKKLLQINDQIILLSKLIDDLSLIATAESGQLKLNLEPINLSLLLKETSDIFIDSAKELGINFNQKFDNTEEIDADPFRVKQIFSNIFSNTLKYLSKGDTLTILMEQENNMTKIIFTDDGPGIPKEKLGRIFERFYKVDQNRNRSISGSGLGLAITKQLCVAHNWDIDVKSELSKGSEFIISIPNT